MRASTTLPSRSAACPASSTRSSSRARGTGVPLGDEQPRECELVVLRQIDGRVRRCHAALARPRPRVVEAALGDAYPRPGRGDRPHVGEEAGQEAATRPGRASRSRRRGRPWPAGAPAVAVYRRYRCSSSEARVPELASRPEVLLGPVQFPLLAEHVGQADVQVAGGGEHRAGVALGRGQRPFVEPARLDRTPACQPHARQHDGPAELVGDHAGRVHAGDRLGERLDGRASCPRRPRPPGRGSRRRH